MHLMLRIARRVYHYAHNRRRVTALSQARQTSIRFKQVLDNKKGCARRRPTRRSGVNYACSTEEDDHCRR